MTHIKLSIKQTLDFYNETYKTLRGRKAANTRNINWYTNELAELKTDMAGGRKYHLGEPIFLVIMRMEHDLSNEQVVRIKLNQ